MAADGIARFQEGDLLDLDTLNRIIDTLNDAMRRLAIHEGKQLRWARTPAGGIGAGGSAWADCVMGGRNPTTGAMIPSPAALTIRVWNLPGGGAVAGNTWVVVGLVNGMWTVLVEPCG